MTAKVKAALESANAAGMHQNPGEIANFAEWLVAECNIRTVVEIGTLKGGTATLWHELFEGAVISIDLPSGRWGGADHGYNERGAILRNEGLTAKLARFIGVLGDSRSFDTARTVQAMLNLKDDEGLADLLFIDGDHSFDGVVSDYALYSRMVRPGGVIAFHDILDTEIHRRDGVEVKQFWDALPGKKKHAFIQVNAAWGGIGAVIR